MDPLNHRATLSGRVALSMDMIRQQSKSTMSSAAPRHKQTPHLESGMSLLDCGCGPGTITLGLADAISLGQAVGIDIESTMVEQATRFARDRQVANVRFEVANRTVRSRRNRNNRVNY